ncbi:hypothetical protein NDU88_005002 [Pleurodeles waltl]|uniref:Uncharacterized protein n=1 Tax=Pleurodeles waltl TaxID=8319 RepID=A0AAV7MZ65_PLEWA|nr:hypothetical protein NDU88_005002 [Pleurodeles waltl]
MSELLDRHSERIDMVERQMSEGEDKQVTALSTQKRMDKVLHTLQAKVEDLEARLRHNIRIVGLAESTNNGNRKVTWYNSLSTCLDTKPSWILLWLKEHTDQSQPAQSWGAKPHPVIAVFLNYRDCDAALRKAQKLGACRHEGSELSIYPAFTQQVLEAHNEFLSVKCKLQERNLENSVLYSAHLEVMVDEKPAIFGGPKQLQHFLKNWTAGWGQWLSHRSKSRDTGIF